VTDCLAVILPMFEDLVQCVLVSDWHETIQLCDIMDLLISIIF